MSSELSETEKRKLIRERRQKKFSNGGASARLNRITGQAENSQLDTESPLDSKSSRETTPTVTKVDSNTEEMDELLENIATSPSNKVEKSQKKKEQATSPQETIDPELEIFKQLAENQQNDVSTPDLFSMLRSMKDNMAKSAATDTNPPLEPVDQQLLDYNNYLINNLKVWSIIFKWCFFLIPYLFALTRSEPISFLPEQFSNPSNFFMIFLSFEIVATSIYFQKLQNIEKSNKINGFQSNNKIVNLVSLIPEGVLPVPDIKGKVIMALQYWDVFSMFLTDICFVLVMMGLFKLI
ncbi:hypothetical protein Kpol_411p4 [Vanderwaltozyma polyspora DSM 70294]|uniref:Golgi to ER traffic protein 2 n=1 Tax=Vanderwaltozyma polyspora (strain ATCC 22028 / DSM 70294 / BCRC 21397 / CBS 2163 / NBRC 10782 / NRRL Y-8283 / UCD 57-17) TaxID=436907 RepID=GET2_VANPO|nr:uncharacterized protein Kpol_411p4 [Vanderwaltozyma polyspora DSM 70294]A7TRN7.1 RecName: Full=Golgi to ER traffic protein 2 [Vanderwaltozyma polyspora DSM 70294]EDO15059.1 hypothetical protein Kpol_411p4 [Vanderwaltozyma polyspora DSM 70294]